MWSQWEKRSFVAQSESDVHRSANDQYALKVQEWMLAQQYFNLLSV